MTFAETQTLIADIQSIETWAKAWERESNKESPDWDRLAELRTWLEEAKQTIFERCTTSA